MALQRDPHGAAPVHDEWRAGQGVVINMADGPVTAATDLLRWTSPGLAMGNLLIIALLTLIITIALVPIEAAPHRFRTAHRASVR